MEKVLVGIGGVGKFLRSEFQASEVEAPCTAATGDTAGVSSGLGRAKEVDS